jgi:CRISPR-associated protein Csm2
MQTIIDNSLKGYIIDIVKQKRELEKAKKNKNKGLENQLNGEIKRNYKNLMKLINQKIDNINIKLSELDEEEFIQQEGLCEAISIGLQFKRTQLRKFFSEIKDIKIELQKVNPDDIRNIGVRLIAVIPKLAYSKGRDLIDEEFYLFMKILIQKLRNELNKDNFKKFDQIFEAIIAYHTYHHPKEE